MKEEWFSKMTVGFCEFFQSVSPGAVETEIIEASEFPKDMEVFAGIPYLKSKDIADAVIYVLGTPPHVQVGTQYFVGVNCAVLTLLALPAQDIRVFVAHISALTVCLLQRWPCNCI
jgi:hypothetical protein